MDGIHRIAHAEFRGRVDEAELDLFEVPTRSVGHERFSESDYTLLGTSNATLENQEIVLHNTVMREATHGGDRLLRRVEFGGGVVFVVALSDAVDLLVDLRSVVITVCVWIRKVPKKRKKG